MTESSTYSLFCMGHPLLDIQVRDGEKLLEKYGLKADDAILAKEKHAGMYDLLLLLLYLAFESNVSLKIR